MKRMMVMAVMLLVGGCAQYTQVQMDLVTQARKGVGLVKQASDARQEVAKQLHDVQRRRLDEAFDGDARANANLTAQWVIEARKAYAVAVDALERQEAAALEAEEVQQRNLQAADEALKKVYWLQQIQMQWTLPKELFQ